MSRRCEGEGGLAGRHGPPSTPERRWGPSHQHIDPPRGPGSSLLAGLAGVVVLFFVLASLKVLLTPGGGGVMTWTLRIVLGLAAVRLLSIASMAIVTSIPRTSIRREPVERDTNTGSCAALARAQLARCGDGAYLGLGPSGEWITADAHSAVMVLGPPRSGKTSAVMIPALMSCAGPAVSTSTKPDVMEATMTARCEIGQPWLFDPSGEEVSLPAGARRLRWSPVAGARTWDDALLLARAMTAATRTGAGTSNESHWSERASALLAPLLYAAHLTEQPIEEVLRWTLRQELAPAMFALEDNEADIAVEVLTGISRTEARERSSIFSATAGTLAAYNSDAVRETAADANFDPARFAESADTIYTTAPEHKQALCAPLIVGLLEQVRHAAYRRARDGVHDGPPMLWLLDEVANTAPIHDLPALVSQAGGQGLQVVIGLQDLSQARTRWGEDAADGFMSLFQTRLVLSGIADARTLESISLALGEYDREGVSRSLGRSAPDEWLAPTTHSETVSYQTHRERVLTPGDIAHLPAGRGLLLRQTGWGLLRLTPWHATEPWCSIALRVGKGIADPASHT